MVFGHEGTLLVSNCKNLAPPASPDDLAAWNAWHGVKNAPEMLQEIESFTGSELALQSRLRSRYLDDVVRRGILLVQQRKRAAGRFTRAAEMWFERQWLEQATTEQVARHKALRFEDVVPAADSVLDLCTGCGGDAIQLAAKHRVVTVDQSPIAGLLTCWNAAVYGVQDRIEVQTQSAELVAIENAWVHIDPDRRATASGRVVRVEDYVPGLEFLQKLATVARGGAIKLSPAANFGGKFPNAEVEIISLNGECKEATVWFGDLRTQTDWRATVLPHGATLSGNPLAAVCDHSLLESWLYDPDPAVVRAGLVDVLAESLDIARLDRDDEYLTGTEPCSSPFVRSFRVLDELPNNLRELAGWFRSRDFGQVEIKCRQVPVQAAAVRAKLPLKGSRAAVVLFARIAGKARIVIAERVQPTAWIASSMGTTASQPHPPKTDSATDPRTMQPRTIPPSANNPPPPHPIQYD